MSRATSPVVAVVLLAMVTVVAAAGVGLGLATSPADPVPVAELRLSVDAGADALTLRHAGGDTIDVDDLAVAVRVDGHPLAHQPPVPFFAARGFRSGPTGPFNGAHDPSWRAGQRATLRLASTNDPLIDPGDRVTVTLATERGVVATLTAAAS